jgi:trehalose 6-phosphate phosphatase
MAAVLECIPSEAEVSSGLAPVPFNQDLLFQSLLTADSSALLLDFDGTLAPFRNDPAEVRPWAHVPQLLEQIQDTGRTRLAIISGRPAQQVASQLSMTTPPEIWGLHGAERLLPNGDLERDSLLPDQEATLEAARHAIHVAALGLRIEEKWNAVVVHWRGKSKHASELAQTRALNLLSPFAKNGNISLLQFDGGIELRAGRNKGDAVRLLLQEIPTDAPVAYLGDDTTDEHAFEALAGRGLGILVRRTRRPSAAQLWLKPPAQLREFLVSWLHAVRR